MWGRHFHTLPPLLNEPQHATGFKTRNIVYFKMEELRMFLANIKLEQYLGNLGENGYDDFKFMLSMSESEVREMLEDANTQGGTPYF